MNEQKWLLAVIVGLAITAQAAHAQHPTVDVYGTLPNMVSASVSPDGQKLATLETLDGDQIVAVRTIGRSGSARGAQLGTAKARAVSWAGPNHVLATISQTVKIGRAFRQVESHTVLSIDISKETMQPVQMMRETKGLDLQVNLGDVITPLWTDDGTVVMTASTRRGQYYSSRDLYKIDSRTGDGPLYARGELDTRSWIVTPDGQVMARIDGPLILLPQGDDLTDAKSWKHLPLQENLPYFAYMGLHSEPDAIVANVTQRNGREVAQVISLKDASFQNVLFEHPTVNVGSGLVDPYTGVTVGVTYTEDRTEQMFFDLRLQAILNGARKALPDRSVALVSWSRDRKRFVIHSESTASTASADAGTFWLMDTADGSMTPFGRAYPQIAASSVALVKPFTYKSRDDKTIHAYLTTPPGLTSHVGLPLVVMPHGGPAARDDASFDWFAQFLATRGYAVLKMNFRGSSGYGDDFLEAGWGEWGRKMQDDVTDGVQHLIKDGTADPSRICIVGASYGGYAALAGAAFTPELYRCAVSVAGVGDLEAMYKWITNRYLPSSPAVLSWKAMLKPNKIDLDDVSPINFAENVKADILLIHGKDDTNVPFKQSEMMESRLRRSKKSVEFVSLEGEDHWLSRSSTRLKMLAAIETFLAKHLGAPALNPTTAAQSQN